MSKYQIFEYIQDNDHEKLCNLLQGVVNFNATNIDGDVAIIAAVRCGNTEAVRVLIESGARIDVCDPWDETPLEIASNNGFMEIVNLLNGQGSTLLSHESDIVDEGVYDEEIEYIEDAAAAQQGNANAQFNLGEIAEEDYSNLRNSKPYMLEVVKNNGLLLEYASEDLRNDKEVVLKAVSQNGKSLEYASADLRNDKEVVLKAVSQNGESLRYASADLRNDKEVVLMSVR